MELKIALIMKSKKRLLQLFILFITVPFAVLIFHFLFAESFELLDYIELNDTSPVNHQQRQRRRDPNQPVLVSAFSSDHFYEAQGLVQSIHHYLPDHLLIIYDLGLSDHQRDQLVRYCRCDVRSFPFDLYPKHVSNLQTYSFKPIIIEQSLMEFRFIFWIDASVRFLTSQVESVWQQAQTIGFAANQDGTVLSCLTHPSMFTRLNVSDPSVYEKAREVAATFLLFTDKPTIVQKIVQPWMQCALDAKCIAPEGHRPRGCQFALAPQYCGCHRYDQSALGILVYKLFPNQLVYEYRNGTGAFAPFFIGDSGIVTIRRTHKVSYFPSTK